MHFSTKTGSLQDVKTQCLVLGVFAQRRLDAHGQHLDQASKGALKQALRQSDVDGNAGSSQILGRIEGIAAERVLLLGLGESRKFDNRTFGKAVENAVRQLDSGYPGDAVLAMPAAFEDKAAIYRAGRDAVIAAAQALYRFDEYKSRKDPPKRPLKRFALWLDNGRLKRTADKAVRHGQAIADGMALARDLANRPGNICTPSHLADEARRLGRRSAALKVTVLEEKSMEKLGMGALLSVSRGSRQPAKLIIMEYKGGKPGDKPVALVGKGVTFDAGGISIKPAANMDEMKYDMCGGASVFGTIAACVELELPINVVGVVPASENLPDGAASKPGDIVTSMSGQTIEVLNTDAEGRLILCDALTYTERFKPAAVIDIATLTGACIIALGNEASGLLSNDDKLAEEVLAAGEHTGDRAWRLPLWDSYQPLLDSNFADMANIGNRTAGTITAACFLARFTEAFKWSHLDIAGTAWKSGAEKGATGRPVPLLSQFLINRCHLAE